MQLMKDHCKKTCDFCGKQNHFNAYWKLIEAKCNLASERKRTQTQNKSFNMKPFGKSLRKMKPQKKQSKSKHFLVETK